MTKRVYALLLTALFLFIGAQLKTEIFPLRTQDTPKQKISCYWDSPHQSKTTTTQVEKQETAQRVKLNEVKRKQVAASFVSETTGTGTNVTAQMTSAEQLPEMAETAEVNCPETVFHGETDYMRVTVRAAEGAFPYGTEMRVEPVDSEIALQAVNNSGHEASDAMAVDITFWYEDEEVQPEGNVSVFLHAKSQIAGNMHQAMTINDEGVATLLGSAGETASLFNTNHFTVYGIVGTTYQDEKDQKSRIVYWYHAGNPEDSPEDWPVVRKEIYAEGDSIKTPANPAGNDTHVFADYWYVGDADGNHISPELLVYNDSVVVIPDASKGKGPAESDLDIVHVFPEFNKYYKVTFYADAEKTSVLKTEIVADGAVVSMINEDEARTNGLIIMEGKTLVAWRDGDGNEILIDDSDVHGGMVTINGENIDLIPVYANAHRVSFDLVQTVAFPESIPEQIVENGDKIEDTQNYVIGQEYKFYTFGGWYTDDHYHPEASTLDEKYTGSPVDLSTWELSESDDNTIVLHAKWIPENVKLPVTPFREDQNVASYVEIIDDIKLFEWEPGAEFPIGSILSHFHNTKYQSQTQSGIGVCHLSGNGVLDDVGPNAILVDGEVLPAVQVMDKEGNVIATYDFHGIPESGSIEPDDRDIVGSVRVNYNRDRYHLHIKFRLNDTILISDDGFTLNATGLAKAAAYGLYDIIDDPVVFPDDIIVKHSQHLYKVTHLVYDYGPIYDRFFRTPFSYYRQDDFLQKGGTVFDETNQTFPVRPKVFVNNDGGDLNIECRYNPIQKNYTYATLYYDNASSWNEILAGAEATSQSSNTRGYKCDGKKKVLGITYLVGSEQTFAFGKKVGDAYRTVAITGHQGYTLEGGSYQNDPDTIVWDSEERIEITLTSRNGYWDGTSNVTGNNPNPADTIYFHRVPNSFMVTFKQTKDNTVNGFPVSDPLSDQTITSVYYGTPLLDILAEAPNTPEWSTLTDNRGAVYSPVGDWKCLQYPDGVPDSIMQAEDLVFYREWMTDNYNVTLDYDYEIAAGISTEEIENVPYGKAVPSPTEEYLTRDDYLLTGWKFYERLTDEDGNVTRGLELPAVSFNSIVTQDLYIVAQWAPKRGFNVEYRSGDHGIFMQGETELTTVLDPVFYRGTSASIKYIPVADEDYVFVGYKIIDNDGNLHDLDDQKFIDYEADYDIAAEGAVHGLIALVAQYESAKAPTTSVVYHANFPEAWGVVEPSPDTVKNLAVNKAFQLAGNMFDSPTPGFRFVCWVNESGDHIYTGNKLGHYFYPGELAISGREDNDLYALWEFVQEDVPFTVTKVWVDNDDQDGKRPESVTVKVTVSVGEDIIEELEKILVITGESWTADFTLPKYDETTGTVIDYDVTVTELNVPAGYTPSYDNDNLTVTNTRITTITAIKEWDDEDNIAYNRPSSVQFILKQNDVPFGEPVTVSDPDWKHSWDSLPCYNQLGAIKYSFEEVTPLIQHLWQDRLYPYYTYQDPIYSEPDTNATKDTITFKVTNTYKPRVRVEFTKIWDDQDNVDGSRPASVTVNLLRNGVATGQSIVLDGTPVVDGNPKWDSAFNDLPYFDNTGLRIEYSISENDLSEIGYTTNIERTNCTSEPQEPEPEQPEPQVQEQTVGPQGTEIGNDVPFTEPRREQYVEPIVQECPPLLHQYTITNSHTPDSILVNVTKIWNDENSDKRTKARVKLYRTTTKNADFNPTDVNTTVWNVVVDDTAFTVADTNSIEWKLPVLVDGDSVYYAVSEVVPTGYQATYGQDGLLNPNRAPQNDTVVNTQMINITALKIWDDNDNISGNRPASIKFKLKQNNVQYGESVTVNAYKNWKHTWENLPALDLEGEEFNYSFEEVTPIKEDSQERLYPYYTYQAPVYSDPDTNATKDTITFRVTNSYDPRVRVEFRKVWNDQDNADGSRPESITVTLLADGVVVDTIAPIVLNETTGWDSAFKNLPYYKTGGYPNYITYTISENSLVEIGYTTTFERTDCYEAEIPESDANGVPNMGPRQQQGWQQIPEIICHPLLNEWTITNSHTPDSIMVSVTKIWNDKSTSKRTKARVSLYRTTTKNADFDPTDVNTTVWNVVVDDTAFTVADTNSIEWKLPVLVAGDSVYYAVSEVVPTGYQATYGQDGLLNPNRVAQNDTIVNTEELTITAQKIWDDEDNIANNRPTTIKFKLKQNNVQYGDVVTVSDPDWKHTWENLPALDLEGEEFNYSFEEITPIKYNWEERLYPDYSYQDPVYSEPDTNATKDTISFKVTNIYKPRVRVEFTKIWNDQDNADGSRPESITVTLFADGVSTGQSITLNETTGWDSAFSNLPFFKTNGMPINYSITENDLTEIGYTTIITPTNCYAEPQEPEPEQGHEWTPDPENDLVTLTCPPLLQQYSISNNHTPDSIVVSVTKIWDDENNAIRTNAPVRLYRTTTKGAAFNPAAVSTEWTGIVDTNFTQADTNSIEWKLPVLVAGDSVYYAVSEVTVPTGYKVSYRHGGLLNPNRVAQNDTIVNKALDPATVVGIPVKKLLSGRAWLDTDTFDMALIHEVSNPMPAKTDTIDGVTIRSQMYIVNDSTVVNDSVRLGRFGAIVFRADHLKGKTDSTFTYHIRELTSSESGLKRIAGITYGSERYEMDIKVSLGATAVRIDTVEFYKTSGSLRTPIDTPIVKNTYNDSITYYHVMAEKELARFGANVPALNDSDFVFIMEPVGALKDKAPMPVHTKTVAGVRQYTAYNIGSEVKFFCDTFSTQNDGLKFSYMELKEDFTDQQLLDTLEFEYKLYENIPTGAKNLDNGFYYRSVKVSGDSIDEYYDAVVHYRKIIVFMDTTGGKIVLHVEGNVDDHAIEFYTKTSGDTTFITSSEKNYQLRHTSADGVPTFLNARIGRREIPVEKKWIDGNDALNTRPEKVTVTLYADSAATDSVVNLKAEDWAHTFKHLTFGTLTDTFTVDTIIYYVEEADVPNYTLESRTGDMDSKFIFTNKVEQQYTQIPVTKTWADNSNQDGIRPDSVTFKLTGQTTMKDTVFTIKVGGTGDQWDTLFKNLPVFDDARNLFDYNTLVELNVPTNYTAAVIHTADGFSVTNTHTPEDTTLAVVKLWDDADNQDGMRPTSVTVKLLAGTDSTNFAMLNAGNNWQAKFEGLDKYKEGTKINYSIVELNVPENYNTPAYGTILSTSGVDTLTVTNTHIPEVITINGTKVWSNDDASNRPEKITIRLYADGTELTDSVKTVTGSAWTWSWQNLPKHKNAGTPIVYTISEDDVNGYTTTITGNATEGFTVTNTAAPDIVKTVNGEKDIYIGDWKEEFEYSITTTIPVMDGLTSFVIYDTLDENLTFASAITSKVDGTDVPHLYSGQNLSVSVPAEMLTEKQGKTVSISFKAKFKEGKSYADLVDYENYSVPNKATYKINTNLITKNSDTVYVTPAIICFKGKKTWDDNDNRAGQRPASIAVEIKNGTEVLETIHMPVGNKWEYTSKNYPVFNASGDSILYTVVEQPITGYKAAEYSDPDTNALGDTITVNITNPYEEETVEVTVNKIWNDENNIDGSRPANININLYADYTEGDDPIQSVTLTGPSWSHTFSGLQKFRDGAVGQPIIYTVDEETVPAGYTKSISGYNITNSYTPARVNIPFRKIWNDNSDQDGKRPETVTFGLFKGDATEPAKTEVVSAAEDIHNGVFANLLKKENGNEVSYSVKELNPATNTWINSGAFNTDYTTSLNMVEDTFAFTNAYTPEVIKVTAIKIWDDDNNVAGFRPGSLTFILKQDGTTVGGNVTVTATDNWRHTWTNLPKYHTKGQEHIYTVSENTINDYTSADPVKSVVDDTTKFTFTNTYEPGKTSLTVIKNWDDANDQDAVRPASVQVKLQRKSPSTSDSPWEDVQTATLSATTTTPWSHTFSDLEIFVPGHEGVHYEYRVREIGETDGEYPVDGGRHYDVEYSVAASGNHIIKNSLTPADTTIAVKKVWEDENNRDGKRPTSVKVQLLAGGTPSGDAVTLSETNGWSHTYTNLPKYNHSTTPVVYTIKEYTMAADGTPQTTLADEDGESVADGLYYVNYGSIPGNGVDTLTATNSHTPETMTVRVNKEWNDENNRAGLQPSSVTVTLKADGSPVGEAVTLDENNFWEHDWDNLNVFREGAKGDSIVYTITENDVPNYSYEVTDEGIDDNVRLFTVTNTHEVEYVSVSVTKSWNDANNVDNLRPASVAVQLYRQTTSGNVPVGAPVILQEPDWSHIWTGLDKVLNGENVVYVVDETEIPSGYAKTSSGSMTDGFTITNSHTPAVTSVQVTKQWNDENNRYGIRPASIQVQLYANGIAKEDPVTLSDENSWSYTWENLPLNNYGSVGVPVTYSVQETSVPAGYTSGEVTGNAQHGFVIPNNIIPVSVKITAKKVWADADNQDAVRPVASVQLYADGTAHGAPVQLTEAQEFTHTWQDLAKYKAGESGVLIVYTVKEVGEDNGKLPGLHGAEYSVTYAPNAAGEPDNIHSVAHNDTMVITNSYTPEVVNITAGKNWNDADNIAGVRPATLTYTLKRNGVDHEPATVGEAQGWSKTWSGLPKYQKPRTLINYEVVESPVNDYTSSVATATTGNSTTYTFTNTYVPGDTSITVTKIWNDGDNQDGLRPENVTVLLERKPRTSDTWAPYTSKSLGGTNPWSHTFSYLDIFVEGAVGVRYDYRVKEAGETDGKYPVAGGRHYDVTYNITEGNVAITNALTPKDTTIAVRKVWADGDNQDGWRPSNVAVQLFANSDKVGSFHLLNGTNNWTYTYENLPMYNGSTTPIAYTVKEHAMNADGEIQPNYVDDGGESIEGVYTTTYGIIAGSGVDTLTVTNTHVPDSVLLTLTKIWDDENSALRQPIEAQLYSTTNKGASFNPHHVTAPWSPVVDVIRTLTVEDTNSVTWHVPVFHNGDSLYYAANEVVVPAGYHATYRHGGLLNPNGTLQKDTIVNKELDPVVVTGIPVIKNLDGRAWLETDTFMMVFIDYENNPMPANTLSGHHNTYFYSPMLIVDDSTTVSEAKRSGRFGAITFKAEHMEGKTDSTFTYHIREFSPLEAGMERIAGVTYGEERYRVDIKIHAGATSLEIDTIEYYSVPAVGGRIPVDTPMITNIFNEASTRYRVTAEKALTVCGNVNHLANNEFAFVLTPVGELKDDAPMPANTVTVGEERYDTAYNQGSQVNFSYMEFSYEDLLNKGFTEDQLFDTLEFEYLIYEVIPADAENLNNGIYHRGIVNSAGDSIDEYYDALVHSRSLLVWIEEIATDRIELFVRAAADDHQGEYFVNSTGNKVYVTPDDPRHGIRHAGGGVPVFHNARIGRREIRVKKDWIDANDILSLRPGEVTVTLHADDAATDSVATLNVGNDWAHTFKHLPIATLTNVFGLDTIIYTVEEGPVANYTTSISGNMDSRFDLTNTIDQQYIKIPVRKVWEDLSDNDDKRPDTVQFRLTGTTALSIVTFDLKVGGEGDSWDTVFKNIPYFDDARNIYAYELSEPTTPEGYTQAVDNVNKTITNSYTPDSINLYVYKHWSDAENVDNMRQPVKMVLYQTTEPSLPFSPASNNPGWTKVGDTLTITDLNDMTSVVWTMPKYNAGKEIRYAVKEVTSLAGYVTTYDNDGLITPAYDYSEIITNTHKLPVDVSLEVAKMITNREWFETDTFSMALLGRPKTNPMPAGSVENDGTLVSQVLITSSDSVINDSVRLDFFSPITFTMNHLQGKTDSVFTYTLRELAPDVNNVTSIPGISYSLQRFIVKIKVERDDSDSLHATVEYWAAHVEGGADVPDSLVEYPVIINRYDEQSTNAIISANKSLSFTGDENRLKDNDFSFKMRPVGQHAAKAPMPSFAVGTGANREITVTNTGNEIPFGGDEGFHFSYVDLRNNGFSDEQLFAGVDFSYMAWEVIPDGAVNHDNGTMSLKVGNIETYYDAVVHYRQLHVYITEEPGDVIKLIVEPVENTYFDEYYLKSNGDTVKLVRHTPESDFRHSDKSPVFRNARIVDTAVAVTKVWDDDDDENHFRPASVNVTLYADGAATESVATLSEANGWKHTFTGIPFTKLNSQFELDTIVYTVVEEMPVDHYLAPTYRGNADTGFYVTNTLGQVQIDIPVTKNWQDDRNNDGFRPDSITLTLTGTTSTSTVSFTRKMGGIVEALDWDDDQWDTVFTGLPKYDANLEAYQYTLEEEAVEYYTTEIAGNFEEGFTVTNHHEDSIITFIIRKEWVDNDDQDGIRPDMVYGVVSSQWDGPYFSLNKDMDYTSDPISLRKYYKRNLNRIIVYESPIPDGYEDSYSGSVESGEVVIINTHVPDSVEIKVSKIWDDHLNNDGFRPTSISVNLLANGDSVDTRTIIGTGQEWEDSFGKWPVKSNGDSIEYSLSETWVPGYQAPSPVQLIKETEGVYKLRITNKHVLDSIDLTVVKVWDDNQNQFNLRSDIQLQLFHTYDATAAFDPVHISVTGNAHWSPVGVLKNVSTEEDTIAVTWLRMPQFYQGQEIRYAVKEISAPEHYTVSYTFGGELIEANHYTDTITNRHTAFEPVTLTDLAVQKKLVGREWLNTDIFEMALIPAHDEQPMPADVDTVNDIRYAPLFITTDSTFVSDSVRLGTFAPITFTSDDMVGAMTKTFVYFIRELISAESNLERIEGVTYGAERYEVDITVEADGSSLVVSNVAIYPVHHDTVDGVVHEYLGGLLTEPPMITNRYRDSVTVYHLSADKQLTVIGLEETLQTGDYHFVMKPVGINAAKAPMPQGTAGTGADRTYTTTNEGNAVHFFDDEVEDDGLRFDFKELTAPGMFTPEELEAGIEFEYEMHEVIPDGATFNNDGTGTWTRTTVNSQGIMVDEIYDGVIHFRDIHVRMEEIGGKVVLHVYSTADDHLNDYYLSDTGDTLVLDHDSPLYTQRHGTGGVPIFRNGRIARTSVSVEKLWDDWDNALDTRPEGITVNLLANGVATDSTAVLNEDNGWAYTFENLKASTPVTGLIEYSVQEVSVAHYATSYRGDMTEGFTIVNSLTGIGEDTECTISVDRDQLSDCPNTDCPSVTDEYGNTYQTVKIDGYCWMAENLRTPTANAMMYQSVVRPDSDANFATYGYLYTWHDAAGGTDNPERIDGYVRGICPNGWHLPTEAEINVLLTHSAQEHSSDSLWVNNFGLNSTGFNALPAGTFNFAANRFEGMGTEAMFLGDTQATAFHFNYFCCKIINNVNIYNNGASVRCVKDCE